MPKPPAVDKRKLKDSVAEYLKKGRLDKAVEALEQLALAEPKDTSHKLKLGDCYRKLERPDKAIICYQSAAKAFADLGLLIKAIAAFKVILDIDPRNVEAQRELQKMNERSGRQKPAREPSTATKLARSPASSNGHARAPQERSYPSLGEALGLETGTIDIDDPSGPITDELEEVDSGEPLQAEGGLRELTEEDFASSGEPLELDDPRPGVARAKKAVFTPPPTRPGREIELQPDVHDLPDDAILEDEELGSAAADDEPLDAGPALAAPQSDFDDAPAGKRRIDLDLDLDGGQAPSHARPQQAARAAAAPKRDIEIAIEQPERPSVLRASGAEEEIELMSIGVGEPDKRARARDGGGGDIDQVLGALAPPKTRRKVPRMRVPLFDDLAPGAFMELVNKLAYRRYAAGEQILREGDLGRSFYIIVEGEIRIWKNVDGKNLTLAHLEEGAFFGEMALLSGSPRAANVSAVVETELLEVTDSVLRELAQTYPNVVQSLKRFYRQRLLETVMAISPLLRPFEVKDRRHIVSKFKLRQSAPEEVLVKEGKQSDGLYMILHGGVEISARRVPLARLKEGDIFGETSLLTGEAATATVTSIGNAILLRLGRDQFKELAATHPQILAVMSELSQERAAANRAAMQKQGLSSSV
jgi:CRP-like cAMP-binding protein